MAPVKVPPRDGWRGAPWWFRCLLYNPHMGLRPLPLPSGESFDPFHVLRCSDQTPGALSNPERANADMQKHMLDWARLDSLVSAGGRCLHQTRRRLCGMKNSFARWLTRATVAEAELEACPE